MIAVLAMPVRHFHFHFHADNMTVKTLQFTGIFLDHGDNAFAAIHMLENDFERLVHDRRSYRSSRLMRSRSSRRIS